MMKLLPVLVSSNTVMVVLLALFSPPTTFAGNHSRIISATPDGRLWWIDDQGGISGTFLEGGRNVTRKISNATIVSDKKFQHLAVVPTINGDGSMVAVTEGATGDLYYYFANKFFSIPPRAGKTFVHLATSLNFDHLWAVSTDHGLYWASGTNFDGWWHISHSMKQVTVSYNGDDLWGISSTNGAIWRKPGGKDGTAAWVSNTQGLAYMKSISLSADGGQVWAVGPNDELYLVPNTLANPPLFYPVQGQGTQITATSDRKAFVTQKSQETLECPGVYWDPTYNLYRCDWRRPADDPHKDPAIVTSIAAAASATSDLYMLDTETLVFQRHATDGSFEQFSTSMKTISMTPDGTTLIGIGSIDGKIWYYWNNVWTDIPNTSNKNFQQVVASNHITTGTTAASHMWAIDNVGDVYFASQYDGAFTKESHSMLTMSVSEDGSHVWGTSISHQVWQLEGGHGGTWVLKTDGHEMVKVSVAPDGSSVWGIDENRTVYWRTTAAGSSWYSRPGITMDVVALNDGGAFLLNQKGEICQWKQNLGVCERIDGMGAVKYLVTGANEELFVLDSKEHIYHKKSVNHFEKVSGHVMQLSATPDGTNLMGVDSSNQTWYQQDDGWHKHPNGYALVTVVASNSYSHIWAIGDNSAPGLWYTTALDTVTTWVPVARNDMSTLSISGSGAQLWGTTSAGEVWYTDGRSGTGTWSQVTGAPAMKSVSVAPNGGQVWGVGSQKNELYLIPNTAATPPYFYRVYGAFTHVAALAHRAYAVDSNGDIFFCPAANWGDGSQNIYRCLWEPQTPSTTGVPKQLAVPSGQTQGGGSLWYVDTQDYLYAKAGNASFSRLSYDLASISSTPDGSTVLAVSSSGAVWYYWDNTWTNMLNSTTQGFHTVVASDHTTHSHLYAIDDSGDLYYARQYDGSWEKVSNSMATISVSADGAHVWGTSLGGNVWYTTGPKATWVPEHNGLNGRSLSQVSVAADGTSVWGIDRHRNVWYRETPQPSSVVASDTTINFAALNNATEAPSTAPTAAPTAQEMWHLIPAATAIQVQALPGGKAYILTDTGAVQFCPSVYDNLGRIAGTNWVDISL